MNAVAEDQADAKSLASPCRRAHRDAYAPSYIRVSLTPAATYRFIFTFSAALTTYAYTGYGALESEVTGSQTTTYRYNGQDQ